jgi:hypothetical protein
MPLLVRLVFVPELVTPVPPAHEFAAAGPARDLAAVDQAGDCSLAVRLVRMSARRP